MTLIRKSLQEIMLLEEMCMKKYFQSSFFFSQFKSQQILLSN